MNKATKIVGKILLTFLALGFLCTGISLIIIYSQASHYWDYFFGWSAFFIFLPCIPLLISFLIMLLVGKLNNKSS